MRKAAFTLLASVGFVSGCTAEPVGRGLYVKSPPSPLSAPKNLREKADRDAHLDNERAVGEAMNGHYADALRTIGDPRPELPSKSPTTEDPPRTQVVPASEYLKTNRETILYWQQRRDFAGTGAAPDTYARIENAVVRQTAPSTEAATVAAQTLDIEAAGFGVRLPLISAWNGGGVTTGLGDLQFRFTGWIGAASSMPNTKFAFGVVMNFATGAGSVGAGDGFIRPFFKVGQRLGPIALAGILSATPGSGPSGDSGAAIRYGVALNYNALGRVQPFATIDFSTIAGAGLGGRSAMNLSEGFRFFLDPRDDWQLAVSALHYLAFTASAERSLGGLGSLSYRF